MKPFCFPVFAFVVTRHGVNPFSLTPHDYKTRGQAGRLSQQGTIKQHRAPPTSFPVFLLFTAANDSDSAVDKDLLDDTTGYRRKWRTRRQSTDSTAVSSNIIESGLTTTPMDQHPGDVNVADTFLLKPRMESNVALSVPDVRNLDGTQHFEQETSSNLSASGMISSLTSFFDNSRENSSKRSSELKTLEQSLTESKDLESMDLFQRMLVDAKEMEADSSSDELSGSGSNGDNDDSVGSKIRNLISTLVTVDFFVVCGFLAWFLAGIFASYVLHVRFFLNLYHFLMPCLFL
jgi:hypothetical protein